MITELITQLVQQAPAREPAIVRQLLDELRALGSPLALAIARTTELVDEDLIDPGIALPALAMACATLVDPRVSDRELEAARYEIDTLLPLPGQPPGTRYTISVDDLISRVRRRRT